MFPSILLLLASFLVIFKGADWFVGSAAAIAEGLHVPKVIVGATIVSLGTVSPELFVSAIAASLGQTELAVGNAIGSPVVNIGLIFAACVLFSFIPISNRVIWREGLMMLGASLVAFLISLRGFVDRPTALVLLALTGAYLYHSYRSAHYARSDWQRDNGGKSADFRPRRDVLFFIVGVTLVIGGSRLLVFAGTDIALRLGVSETIIGLTLVAFGTSLPEFFTSITALAKGHREISAGNIIGANLLDITLVLGVSGLIRPLPFDPRTRLLVVPCLILLTLLFVLFGHTHRGFRRWEGLVLLAVFSAYCVALFRI